MNEQLTLLLRCTSMGSRLAVLNEGTLLEYYEDDSSDSSMVGAVLLGKVERVLPDIDAAFVKIGLPQNGFLPIREQESYHQKQGKGPLMSGQEIVVQVKKDAKGSKGVYLTRDVALPGQYALLMPCNSFIGVSKRIAEEQDRERARALGKRLANGRFGLIVRHAALYASGAEVQSEIEELWSRWLSATENIECLKAPAVLSRPGSMVQTVLRDYAARHSCSLWTDDELPAELPPGVAAERLTRTELEGKWNGCRIDSQLSEALKRRVPLKSGGDLIIDEREALQTVDVNSGSAVAAAGEGSLALEHNLSAVPEIVRQIRLRNLCGIILVDFIDMDTEDERKQVQQAMEAVAADDRVKTVIHGFTSLGLLEMTRKRTRDTLRNTMTEPCAACGENGRIRRK